MVDIFFFKHAVIYAVTCRLSCSEDDYVEKLSNDIFCSSADFSWQLLLAERLLALKASLP